ncbi:MAG TPA: TonB-dependent receptor, partial [Chitinispirillaceae bacterium]|nr:TonB-dependent receptor [Chitinispirillaceae bacterium]
MMINKLFTVIFTTTCLVFAQKDSLQKQYSFSTGAFELGKIEVKGKKISSDNLTSQIDSKKMEKHNITNVGQALNALPGISISTIGARYETGVNIRGFDLRQVPLYLDGIPQYVPYDGYVDLGRFTTFDLSEIRIEKGYSSIMYGPNAMGGAINLVTRKPIHKFEFDGMIGTRGYKKSATELNWLPLISGNQFSMNFGSRISDKLYITAGASGLYLDSYNLSEDFKVTAYQPSGLRNQSYHRDAKASAKIGFTPNKGSEYALSYMYQHGEKGGPLYAGPDASVKPRYWRWPYWDKQSVY